MRRWIKKIVKGILKLAAAAVLLGVVAAVGTLLYWELTFWQASRQHPPKSTPVQHDPESPAEKLLVDCDFLHQEMRQDLALGLSQAEALVLELPKGPERATALLARGRIERVRGEYLKAEMSLEEALTEEPDDYFTQARIHSERFALLRDRFGMPWGDLSDSDDDFVWTAFEARERLRTFNSKLNVIQSDMLEAWGNSDAQTPWRECEIRRSKRLAELHFFAGSSSSWTSGGIMSQFGLDSSLESLSRTLQERVQREVADERLEGVLSQERLDLLEARLTAPHQAALCSFAAGGLAPPSDRTTTANVSSIHPQDPLAELEVLLFPGSTPTMLGFRLEKPGNDESTFSLRESSATSRQTRFAAPRESDSLHSTLEEAREGLEAKGDIRALGWLALMEGAWRISLRLDGDTAREDPIPFLERAAGLSETSGDLRTWRSSQVMVAIGAVLEADFVEASRRVAVFTDSAVFHGAYGELVGYGRLMSTLTQHAMLVEYSPEKAEAFSGLALQLYEAAGASLEGAQHLIRWASLLERVGRQSAKMDAVEKARLRVDQYYQKAKGAPFDPAKATGSDSRNLPLSAWSVLFDVQNQRLDTTADDIDALEREISSGMQLSKAAGVSGLNWFAIEKMGADVSFTFAALALRTGLDEIKRRLASRWGPHAELDVAEMSDSSLSLSIDLTRVSRQVAGLLLHAKVRVLAYTSAVDRGKRELLANPDLPVASRFKAAEARYEAGDAMPVQDCVPVQLLQLRGDKKAARELWDHQFVGKLSCVPIINALRDEDGDDEFPEFGRILLQTWAVSDVKFMGRLLKSIDHPDEALRILRAHERLTGTPTWYDSLQDPWQYMALYVDAYSGLGQHDKSLPLAHDMVSRLEKRRENMFDEVFRRAWLDRTDSSDVYGSAVLAASLADNVDDTLEFMERAKARSLQDRIGSPTDPRLASLRRLADEVALRESMLTPARCTKDSAPCAHERFELERALVTYRDARDRMGVSAVPGVEGDFQQLSVRLLSQLPPDAALVSFYWGTQRLSIVGLAPGQAPLVRTVELPPPGELAGRIDRLSESLNSRVEDSAFDRDKAILSNLLVGPLEPLLSLPTIKRLYLVPHAELQRVPFALLNFEGRPLVERFVVRELPYASLLLAAQTPGYRQAVSLSMDDNDVMGFGGDQKSLNLRQELKAVSGIYGVQWDVPPTRSRVLEALTRDGMLHLAAHGASGTRNEMLSMLVLPRDKNGDEDLSPLDILLYSQPLQKRCVVLSSCFLGMEHKTAGDDGTGITRALLQKGVGEVVMGLWTVPATEEANLLLVDFHRRWRVTQDAAEALAEAQRAAIARGIRPSVWATFVVMGR